MSLLGDGGYERARPASDGYLGLVLVQHGPRADASFRGCRRSDAIENAGNGERELDGPNAGRYEGGCKGPWVGDSGRTNDRNDSVRAHHV